MRRDVLPLAWRVVALALAAVGVLALLLPVQFAMRSTGMTEAPTANIPLIYALGCALIAAATAIAAERDEASQRRTTLACAAVALLVLGYFVALTFRLADWWIDDAGITFAYSRSLAEGLGIVAQPWLPPEEGYSSSAWMLTLAAAARLGADIPLAAKALGIGFSGLALLICTTIVARETRSPVAVMICGIGIAVTPTVVWSASGQEHALQSLLLLGVVVCAWATSTWRWPAALVLSVYVLTRPEGPMIVIAVFVAAVWLTRRAGGRLINAADLAVAGLPFLAFVSLFAFRILYFGDPLPNPFYAKTSEAGLIGLINPLGGGWFYLMWGLRETALLLVLGLVFLIRPRPWPTWVVIAWAVVIGHVFFMVWAKGDWMGQFRFLMPILPVAILLAATSVPGLGDAGRRRVYAVVATLVLAHSTIVQTGFFAERPTTPMAAVTAVGNTFRALADRLRIADPLLAHHDAGGIAYHRMVRLADLGGLINRTIGQHMDDALVLTPYLVDELRPDFFFGARNFAARSGFADTPAFQAAYVPLVFPDQPEMQTELAYIRRSRVTGVPGVTPVYDVNGALVAVTIDSVAP